MIENVNDKILFKSFWYLTIYVSFSSFQSAKQCIISYVYLGFGAIVEQTLKVEKSGRYLDYDQFYRKYTENVKISEFNF